MRERRDTAEHGGGKTLRTGPKRLERHGGSRLARGSGTGSGRLLAVALRLVVATAAVATLATAAECVLCGSFAVAQQAALAVKTAPELRAETASRLRFPIEVGPEQAIARNSFIRIRGMPPTAALTEGHAIAAGSWAVPLAALPALGIILPAGLEGRFEVAISLVSIDGTVLAETRTTLLVVPPRPKPPPAQAGASLAPPLPKLSPADRERALGLYAKGMEQLHNGSVYAARKFFELAANIGLAEAAVAVAATYDPDELARLNVVGLQPDPAAARKWYEKARELGAIEASERLRRLGLRQ